MVLLYPVPPTARAAAQPARALDRGTRRARGPGGGRTAKLLVSSAFAVGLLAIALPRVAGVEWAQIWSALGNLTPGQLVFLALVWMAGLWVHTPALTAALPGLSHRRALLLNLTGSFVSNLLPLGGAAGTVANWTMARSWGFTPPAFARWALVTNLFDTLLKLSLPGVALCWLAAAGVEARGGVSSAAYLGLSLLTLVSLGVWLLARDDRAVRAIGRAADRVAHRVSYLRPPNEGYAVRAAAFRRDSAVLITNGWGRLAGGKVAYATLQAALLWLCLRAVGVEVSPAVVLAVFAVERILSMAVITPGATGVVELGMTGALLAFHVEAVPAAAAVLVYRAFTFGMEIPVGGLSLLAWARARHRAFPGGGAAAACRPAGRVP